MEYFNPTYLQGFERLYLFNEFENNKDFFIKLQYYIQEPKFKSALDTNKPLINQTAYNGQPIFSAYDNIDFKRYTLKQEQVEQSGIPNILLVSETYGYAPSFVYTSYSSEMYTRYGIEDPSGYLREAGNKTAKYNTTNGYCEIGCPTSDKFKVGDSIFIHIDPNYYMGEILYGFTSNFVPIVEIDSVNHKLKVNANDITIRCDENELQYSGTSLLFYDMINDPRRGVQTITRNFSSIPKQSRIGTTISKISFYESVPALDQKFSPVDATGDESEIINSVSTPNITLWKKIVAGTATPEEIGGINGITPDSYMLIEDAALERWNGIFKKTLKYIKCT